MFRLVERLVWNDILLLFLVALLVLVNLRNEVFLLVLLGVLVFYHVLMLSRLAEEWKDENFVKFA